MIKKFKQFELRSPKKKPFIEQTYLDYIKLNACFFFSVKKIQTE